jgi:hypothetical protein
LGAKAQQNLAVVGSSGSECLRFVGPGLETGAGDAAEHAIIPRKYGIAMNRSVELRVREGGEDVLVYTFETAALAAEMIRFLSGFFPRAEFLVQPLRH